MKKILFLFFFSQVLVGVGHSQLMVSKMIGKNSNNLQLGYGLFTYFDFPLGNAENQSFRVELMDLAYYPQKNSELLNTIGYLSTKLGYKYVFSEDQSGFYIEPAAGYCRVVSSNPNNELGKDYGDGVAVALETGYSIPVGQAGNTINLGLKYEDDLAGSNYTASSIGFRVSFSFHIFGRKND